MLVEWKKTKIASGVLVLTWSMVELMSPVCPSISRAPQQTRNSGTWPIPRRFRVQGRIPDMPGIPQNTHGPVSIPLKRYASSIDQQTRDTHEPNCAAQNKTVSKSVPVWFSFSLLLGCVRLDLWQAKWPISPEQGRQIVQDSPPKSIRKKLY